MVEHVCNFKRMSLTFKKKKSEHRTIQREDEWKAQKVDGWLQRPSSEPSLIALRRNNTPILQA
jgi:hypothetical protein